MRCQTRLLQSLASSIDSETPVLGLKSRVLKTVAHELRKLSRQNVLTASRLHTLHVRIKERSSCLWKKASRPSLRVSCERLRDICGWGVLRSMKKSDESGSKCVLRSARLQGRSCTRISGKLRKGYHTTSAEHNKGNPYRTLSLETCQTCASHQLSFLLPTLTVLPCLRWYCRKPKTTAARTPSMRMLPIDS